MGTITTFMKIVNGHMEKMDWKSTNSNFHHKHNKLAKQTNNNLEKNSSELRKVYFYFKIYA